MVKEALTNFCHAYLPHVLKTAHNVAQFMYTRAIPLSCSYMQLRRTLHASSDLGDPRHLFFSRALEVGEVRVAALLVSDDVDRAIVGHAGLTGCREAALAE